MSITAVDWGALDSMTGTELRGQVFSILQDATAELQGGTDLDDPALLAIVPRLAGLLETREDLSSFADAFSGFARSVGLWNYIDSEVADARDELAAEVARIPELGIVLHREQMTALNILLGGHNLILSAPTSFGKSILIDALLTNERYRRVAIVLPTIALLDEFRRRLVRRFGANYDIVMHHSEAASREHVIFLGTQERLINREDLGTLDLVVVDEFYKLDPSRKDERSVTLNAAVYKLLNRGKQFFFLGPNIDQVSISADSRWRFSFLKTRFATVAVDTYDLRGVQDKEGRLHEEILNEANWPALVFVSSPDKANELAADLVTRGVSVGDGTGIAEWMDTNYGGRWALGDAARSGAGVHHGRIPRSLASRFVTLFNRGTLPILICTSTLIEGVNTAAKSVLIYDKRIANRNYDFFTFSNIRGRAGRLGQHHVGRVYLFNTPPEQETYSVSAPLFDEIDDVPDEFVVHVEARDSTPVISERIEVIGARVGLDGAQLRQFSSLGIEVLEKMRAATEEALSHGANVRWSGYPDYERIQALMTIICSVRSAREFGCRTERQLAMYVHQLRISRSMRAFFRWHFDSYRGEPGQLDNVFKFLRAAEYGLPEYCALIEAFVKQKAPGVSYALLVAELPRWFRAEELKILEEQGVPIQISERFWVEGDTVRTFGQRLRDLAIAREPALTPFEHEWITSALPA